MTNYERFQSKIFRMLPMIYFVVFFECSLVEFLKHLKEYDKIKKNNEHNPKLGEMFTHLLNNKIITDSNVIQAINEIKSDWDKPYSLERMNMVNHNENYASVEKDTRAAWGKVEKLMIQILNPKDDEE